jgi:hypothetical protein
MSFCPLALWVAAKHKLIIIATFNLMGTGVVVNFSSDHSALCSKLGDPLSVVYLRLRSPTLYSYKALITQVTSIAAGEHHLVNAQAVTQFPF